MINIPGSKRMYFQEVKTLELHRHPHLFRTQSSGITRNLRARICLDSVVNHYNNCQVQNNFINERMNGIAYYFSK